MPHRLLSLFLLLFSACGLAAQPLSPSTILNERERARVVDEILEDRFNNLLGISTDGRPRFLPFPGNYRM